jgi:CRISPR-associated protein Cmr2
MSNYVLAIAIGPVQEFIASARRTRDLWFGSYVLSEISKATAKFLLDEGAEMIFPAPIHPEKDLCQDSELNVANKILALVPSNKDPKILAEGAEKSARKRWIEFGEKTKKLAGEAIRKDIWDDQVDDVIEFYYAWTPVKNNYKEARERVERILAGRKALRDFIPAKGKAGIPKSSLDG